MLSRMDKHKKIRVLNHIGKETANSLRIKKISNLTILKRKQLEFIKNILRVAILTLTEEVIKIREQ